MPALLQLGDVRIALRVVHELVVRQMMKPELIRRRVDREGRQPIRGQLVEHPVLEEQKVRALVDSAAELMLGRAQNQRREGVDAQRPAPAEALIRDPLIGLDRKGNGDGDDGVNLGQVDPVRHVVARLEGFDCFGVK